ncbi:rho GTPase-activating protein 44-like [Cygnus atratus]|uniref:rho GTPase-activating protein 44-like n=1 Tax=Cygnus atratus TaxID=8868 RepID=UPI0015D5F0F9|nr:rho GTPase-activating protein 44-like [Cygnus atratus]
MKKQFNRMRQLANQTVGRAEKTEVLSEDLLQVEKRLELVKQVSHSTHKKLTACLQGQQGVDADKRSKKLPLTTLAQCLMEGSAVLGDDSLLGKMLRLCGEAEDKLAQELIQFELQVERDVIEPLFVLAEVEIPNIQKQRKHLAKLVLDMDSSRTRWELQPGCLCWVAAVREVIEFVKQPAAVGRQSRCSQGGDGGGSKPSGDLQVSVQEGESQKGATQEAAEYIEKA